MLDLIGPEDTPTTEPPGLEGVGFGRRALAHGIDLVVHIVIGAVIGVVATILVLLGAGFRGVSPDAALARLSTTSFLSFAVALLGGTAMHTLCEGLHGSTLGKRLCGIIVISENGGPSNLLGAIKRNLAYYIDSLFFGLVAYQKMSETPKRQRIGDRWGHTMVVRIAVLDKSTRPSGLRFAAAALTGLTADGLTIFMELAYRLVQ
jgi:uncharacterized RDD family membrane protein YckC